MPGWRDIELGAPGVARLGMARLNAVRLEPLGQLRHHGFPRISQVEPYVAEGQPLIGAMAWSAKAGELRRDPVGAYRTAWLRTRAAEKGTQTAGIGC